MTAPSGAWRGSTLLERALAIAAVIVPLATTFVASEFATASARRSSDITMIQLAVGILETQPAQSDSSLRRWALEVMAQYSPVSMPDKLRRELQDSIPFPFVSYSSPGGSITSSGLFTAGSKPGRYPLVACSHGMCDTAWITITGPTAENPQKKR